MTQQREMLTMAVSFVLYVRRYILMMKVSEEKEERQDGE